MTHAIYRVVVFLDIDGVLNSAAWMESGDWCRSEDPQLQQFAPESWYLMLDPDCVARLKRLVEVVDADIVVSSSWRLALDLGQIDECLRLRGLDRRAVGKTPVFGTERGHEIRAWLRTTGHRGPFVVLDDGGDMDGVAEHLVRTDYSVGLTDEDVDRAISVVRGQR